MVCGSLIKAYCVLIAVGVSATPKFSDTLLKKLANTELESALVIGSTCTATNAAVPVLESAAVNASVAKTKIAVLPNAAKAG